MVSEKGKFDRLLDAMANGQAPTVRKTPATQSASSQDGGDGCDGTQTRPDTSEDA